MILNFKIENTTISIIPGEEVKNALNIDINTPEKFGNTDLAKFLIKIADCIDSVGLTIEDKKTKEELNCDDNMFSAYDFFYLLFDNFVKKFIETKEKETNKLKQENLDLKNKINNALKQ